MPAPPNFETLDTLPPLHTQPPMKRKRVLLCKTIPTTSQLLKEDRRRPLGKFHKWCPQDDLLLKEAAEKSMSAPQIAQMVKFSSKFTPQEIEERWSALLYQEQEALPASKAMVALMQMTRRIPWTREEDELIKHQVEKYGYMHAPTVLDEFKDRFHPSRTVRTLEAHFYRLKRAGEYNDTIHFHHTASNWKKLREYYRSQLTEEQIKEYTSYEPPQDDENSRYGASSKKDETDEPDTPQLDKSEVKDFDSFKRKRDDVPALDDSTQESKRPKTAHSDESNTISASSDLHFTLPPSTVKEEERDISRMIRLERFLPKPDAYAVLDGEFCTLKITKAKTILGRKTMDMEHVIDADLSLHSPRPMGSMSRKQAVLEAQLEPHDSKTGDDDKSEKKQSTENGSTQSNSVSGKDTEDTQHRSVEEIVASARASRLIFKLTNTGKRAIQVNGDMIAAGNSVNLVNQAFLKFPGQARFRFLMNESKLEGLKSLLVDNVKQKAEKREAEKKEEAKKKQEEEAKKKQAEDQKKQTESKKNLLEEKESVSEKTQQAESNGGDKKATAEKEKGAQAMEESKPEQSSSDKAKTEATSKK